MAELLICVISTSQLNKAAFKNFISLFWRLVYTLKLFKTVKLVKKAFVTSLNPSPLTLSPYLRREQTEAAALRESDAQEKQSSQSTDRLKHRACSCNLHELTWEHHAFDLHHIAENCIDSYAVNWRCKVFFVPEKPSRTLLALTMCALVGIILIEMLNVCNYSSSPPAINIDTICLKHILQAGGPFGL